jgi:hypothetical protein
MKSSSAIATPVSPEDDEIPAFAASTSDYDTEFLERIVADAGRWAYGVVLVEVWVMNEHRTQLERPPGGFWVDPVARDYGQDNNLKFQRLIDPTCADYFPPLPQAPGVGIPGALWSQATRGNVAVESSSIRNGTIFGGGGGSRRGHRRNRNLFPFETIGGGNIFGGSNPPATDKANTTANLATETGDNDPSTTRQIDNDAAAATTSSPSISQKPKDNRHRRSASMDAVALAAAKMAHSPSSNRHSRQASDEGKNDKGSGDVEMGTGGWQKSWRRVGRETSQSADAQGGVHHQRQNLLLSDVHWRRISDLANDPDQPFNPRIHYLEYECNLGYAAGVSSYNLTDL